jgi:hypothetical protein
MLKHTTNIKNTGESKHIHKATCNIYEQNQLKVRHVVLMYKGRPWRSD